MDSGRHRQASRDLLGLHSGEPDYGNQIMKIFVTGGTGFVGSYLAPYLIGKGHEIALLVRPGVRRIRPPAAGARIVEGDPLKGGAWWEAVRDCDAAINLIGESIQGRWTDEKKDRIRQSRFLPLRHLVEAMPTERAFTLVSTSAVGYYGDAGEQELDESGAAGNDFLAKLAQDWEARAEQARNSRARVVITRFGIVLGANGGPLNEMVKAMRRFMGGILGSGRQWVSWIHQEDLARAILFLLEEPAQDGAFNFGTPNPVRQAEMARTLGRLLHRPAGFPTPATAIRFAFGGFADALLFSQRMRPARLLEAGFDFHHPVLEDALREILTRQAG